ncbi:methionyl-tRNA formyltransferase [Aliarcobacter butzleri]|uniref:methionyl-tRNA formyltransferase n=1 Tax=Aliarcobacter butzleri TaxID=28197 RepID=UPI000DAF55BA|nr:formyltransferase family protein [Aliarcobacter butzleri]MDN5080233.1 formyltransferase family protein [Aliarcobacter butzleri]PZQ04574.1 MAG: hypothetical protein DI567_10775 [Aliarcobacter butzleri]
MKLIYFAGGNRLDTLKAVSNINEIEISKICITSIESNIDKYKEFADKKNIEFQVYNKKNIEELFSKNDEEILLSVGYRFIIPPSIFKRFKYSINIHPSLLPKYKGAYSGFAIIENGEMETGITAHFIDEGIDTGHIIQQIIIPLTKFDTTKTMSKKVSLAEPIFVSNVIENILKGKLKIEKQSIVENSIYNERRKPEDSRIDETRPLIDLYNKIRACDQENYPAYFELDGKKVKIRLEFENEN